MHAEDSLEAFKKFLAKNKVAQHVFGNSFTLFIKYYILLLNTALGKERDPGLILNDLNKTPVFAERYWLIKSFENIDK